MRVVVIIPDRGDRPKFMMNCHRMMLAQTLAPVRIIHVDYPASSERPDITARYKVGYHVASGMADVDLIAFIENDDYYAPDYLEYVVKEWEKKGKPELFGLNYTI
jgi:hypothetical protein